MTGWLSLLAGLAYPLMEFIWYAMSQLDLLIKNERNAVIIPSDSIKFICAILYFCQDKSFHPMKCAHLVKNLVAVYSKCHSL